MSNIKDIKRMGREGDLAPVPWGAADYRHDAEQAFDVALDEFDPSLIHDFTWSALNFSSFWLQRISFTVAKSAAVAVMSLTQIPTS